MKHLDQIKSRRVLVVDDAPQIADAVANILRRLNYEVAVDITSSAHEALSRVQQGAYSLIITDYQMPDMSGLELAQAVRRISPDMPIVLMSGDDISELRRASKGLDLAAFLAKPFSITRLLDVVQRAVA